MVTEISSNHGPGRHDGHVRLTCGLDAEDNDGGWFKDLSLAKASQGMVCLCRLVSPSEGPSLKSLESGGRHQVVLTRHKRFGTTPAGRWDKLRNPARSERPRGLSLCQAWQPKGISQAREVSEGSLKKNQRVDKVLRPASEKFLAWLDI